MPSGDGGAGVDYKTLVQDDRIHASLYTDPRIFADEMERIFHRGWVFVGHASEIPQPGDFRHEIESEPEGQLVAGSNFILAELSVQAQPEMHWWVGRATHHLRRVAGVLRMSFKKVVLINAAEPLPNLSFLI